MGKIAWDFVICMSWVLNIFLNVLFAGIIYFGTSQHVGPLLLFSFPQQSMIFRSGIFSKSMKNSLPWN
jgi:hypothetical protein